MRKNIAGAGRMVRGVVGLILIAFGWYYHSWWGAIGVIPLVEAVLGWCAIHHICGSDEFGKKEK